MNKNNYKLLITAGLCLVLSVFALPALADQYINVSAGPDLYANPGQSIVLQGSSYNYYSSGANYYWHCQDGFLSNSNILQPTYTAPSYSGQSNYVCTLTASNSTGSYSDTMTVFVNYNNYNNNYGQANLAVSKKAINISRGNYNWQTSVTAQPGDIITFAVTLQAFGSNINNVVLREYLPQNLAYRGNLMINSSKNYQNNLQNISVGTVRVNEPVVVSYQAQVILNLPYGSTTITNQTTVSANEISSQTASASVFASNSQVQGASIPTQVSTGSGGQFWQDSFLLPMIIILAGIWFYYSGSVYAFADCIKKQK